MQTLALITLLFAMLTRGVEGFGDQQHPVRAELLASSAEESEGQVTLGILLTMDPGWHTYWQYAGDAGGPTTVRWTVPDGFEVGALRWPGPEKFVEQGIVGYGYADEVMLMAPAFVRKQPASAMISIQAQVDWIACREICISGNTVLTLDLSIVDRIVETTGNAATFAHYGSRLPSPLMENDPVTVAHAVSDGPAGERFVDLVLSIDSTEVELNNYSPDFYPLGNSRLDLLLRAPELVTSAISQGRVRIEIIPYNEEEVYSIHGLVVYQRIGSANLTYRGIDVDLKAFQKGEVARLGSPITAAPGSLAQYLLFALIGGIILNLMPCVFPVISLKVIGFVSQAGEERARARQLGLSFATGIVATFLVLAWIVVLLKSSGELIGWGFQFQSPAFVIFLTALVFVLGLSLFGLVTVRLPGGQGILGGLAEGEGLGGSFFNGVLATTLATPCTAPFLGTALGFAFSQDAGILLSVFVVTGIGMALPYILLAIEPGWLRFLPRPGPWMGRFKQLMGFLLMATVLWLLWVLGMQLGVEAVIWTMVFMLVLAIAAWILGEWVDLRSSPQQRAVAWMTALGITAVAYGVLLHPLMKTEAMLQSQHELTETNEWAEFTPARVERLVSDGRIVFIDFTAEWCWTCKVNKRAVLESDEVRAKFEELDVALVRADWTNRNTEITRMLQSFGRSGVPLYVIFSGGRLDAARVLPEVITAGIVIENLEEAFRASTGARLEAKLEVN